MRAGSVDTLISVYTYLGVGDRKHMTDKVKVNLTISKEVVEKAKEYGLNMSKIAENALKEYIRRLEGSSQQTETNGGYADARSASQQPRMVPGAGFELATSGHGPVNCSPDYESGAQTRLGYPGRYFLDHCII